MKAIDELIKEIVDGVYEAIQEAKLEEKRSCYFEHYMSDDSCIIIDSEATDYYDIRFYAPDDDEEQKKLPNLYSALDNALPDWDDVELEPEYDEWNEHGFRDEADYLHWRYG